MVVLHVDSDWSDFCSGTLVRADVVLTAAHCTDFLIDEGPDGFGPDDLRISFDPEGDAPYSTVDRIVVHPDWLTAPPGRGNSKHLFLAPLLASAEGTVVVLAVLACSPQRRHADARKQGSQISAELVADVEHPAGLGVSSWWRVW